MPHAVSRDYDTYPTINDIPYNRRTATLTSVGTSVTVTYPYRWRFNSVIQLLVPGARYAATTDLTETSTVHNQT